MSVESFFICTCSGNSCTNSPDCKGIILPAISSEVRFADEWDTTVISSSVASLKASLQIINSFGFGLHLNKTKTKIMWIGSQKGNKDKIMG